MTLLRSPCCVLSLVLAPAARAEVLVVDRAAGPYVQIKDAVLAAAEGDTILVRDGVYLPFTIGGKSLTVVAEGGDARVDGFGGFVFPKPNVTVTGLAAGQQVVVRGLRTDWGVRVADCAGAVWFDEVVVTGTVAWCGSSPQPGALVSGSARVTFTRCALLGELGLPGGVPSASPSGDGLSAQGSSVQLFDCSITGGYGESTSPYGFTLVPSVGGAGMRVAASTVTVVGCTIRGGAGGLLTSAPCDGPHAAGGAGVVLAADAHLRAAETTALGGVADLAPLCPGASAPAGPAIAGEGAIVALPGFARHLRAASPVRGGETLVLELEGRPGETPLVLVSLVHEPLGLLNGCLLVGLPPEDLFVLPALPASGQAALALPVPHVGAAPGALTFCAQAAFLEPGGALWLGAGTTVVLLD